MTPFRQIPNGRKQISDDVKATEEGDSSSITVYTNKCYNKPIDHFPTELVPKIKSMLNGGIIHSVGEDGYIESEIFGTSINSINFSLAIYNVGDRSFIVGYNIEISSTNYIKEIILYDSELNMIQSIIMNKEFTLSGNIVTFSIELDIKIYVEKDTVDTSKYLLKIDYKDYWYNYSDDKTNPNIYCIVFGKRNTG